MLHLTGIDRTLAALCLMAAAFAAGAASVTVGGIMGDKAYVSVDGAPPRVMRQGETRQGVKLLEVRSQSVLVEVEGRRHEVRIGQGIVGSGGGQPARAVLLPDGGGHFRAHGSVNDLPVSFLLDTGASVVVLPRSLAQKAGVSLDESRRTLMSTANGPAPAYRVMLNSLRIGDIRLHLVDAVVMPDERLPMPLLGMSFLSRTDMRQDGDRMTLIQRH